MSLVVKTTSPDDLLNDIQEHIEPSKFSMTKLAKENISEAVGIDIETWEFKDNDRTVFVHSTKSAQWVNMAYLKAEIRNRTLIFNYVTLPEGSAINDYVRGVYHGRFVQMLMSHFADSIQGIEVRFDK